VPSAGELLREGRRGQEERLFAYHWHPTGASPVTWPHLHVLDPASALRKVHLPTGRISLEEVLRLAVVEFAV
jgi:hypothetical protein